MPYVLEELDPVEQAYLEKFRASRTSGNEYTPWLAEGLTEAEYFQKLYLEMSHKVARYEEAVGELKKHLSETGEYAIVRTDGKSMWLDGVFVLGAIFEELDALLPDF